MRRQSFSSSLSSGSGGAGEPLIVVEESTLGEEEEAAAIGPRGDSPPPDSPSLNPYLLSPWRDTRKHSLPTFQCTSGITASQVRRLSERGGEGSGPSSREAAFLATLSQSQPPQPGGRRHSVVTISRVPPTLFGRNRRESIAAFPMGGATRILGGRRDSTGMPSGPPSNSGSTHNLALDIMDDIAEIKAARKVRLKMWKTPSHERVCEVQPLGESGTTTSVPQRYTQNQQRRYSDFSLTTIPMLANARRRASEMPPRGPLIPPPIPPRSSAMPPILLNASCDGGGGNAGKGIVCTNTDLISILSSLTSSATEIDRCGLDDERDFKFGGSCAKTIEQKRNRLKNSRSNSFDVSILHDCGESKQASALAALTNNNSNNNNNNNNNNKVGSSSTMSASSWFTKRHQPMSKKQRNVDTTTTDSPSGALGFIFDKSRMVKAVKDSLINKATSPTALTTSTTTKDEATRNKVVWDGSSGTKVDAQLLGNAIEEFLRSGAAAGDTVDVGQQQDGGKISPNKARGHNNNGKVGTPWFNNNNNGTTTQPGAAATSTTTSTTTSIGN